MKKIVGLLMIIVPIAAMFIIQGIMDGWLETLASWGFVLVVGLIIAIGIRLWEGKL